MNRKEITIAFVCILLIFFIGCKKINNSNDISISIISLNADPESVPAENVSTISAEVDYNGSGVLDYSWSSDSGLISGAGQSIQWHAPQTAGSYTISLLVDDGEVSDNASIVVDVQSSFSISISQPINGEEVDGTVIVRTSVEPCPDSVVFQLSPLSQIKDNTLPFEATFNVSTLSEGNYNIVAIAYWGTQTASDNVTISVINTTINPSEAIIGDWEINCEFTDSFWNDDEHRWEYDYYWYSFILKFRDTGRYQIEMVGYGTAAYGSYTITSSQINLRDDTSGGIDDIYSHLFGAGSNLVTFSVISDYFYGTTMFDEVIPGTWTKRFKEEK